MFWLFDNLGDRATNRNGRKQGAVFGHDWSFSQHCHNSLGNLGDTSKVDRIGKDHCKLVTADTADSVSSTHTLPGYIGHSAQSLVAD
jgi:hypothetical protein